MTPSTCLLEPSRLVSENKCVERFFRRARALLGDRTGRLRETSEKTRTSHHAFIDLFGITAPTVRIHALGEGRVMPPSGGGEAMGVRSLVYESCDSVGPECVF